MTVGITEVKNAHAPTEYTYWTLPPFDSPPLVEGDKKYYLYAKCSKSAATGVFTLSETAIGMEAVSGYYHFLVALLNSEYSGERSVVTLYGYSEILPGSITTDRIVSTDGKTYFDLVNSEIGGKIIFVAADGTYKDMLSVDVAAIDAKDIAEGKRRVFVNQPTTPYDVGDLWVNGQDLRRCSTARASGSYVAADWVLATQYDNTKTVIDGGIVTSGTVQLAGSDSAIKAGITGEGTDDSSVRIWAGATKENKGTAPFRVMQDGSLVASKAKIKGEINATSGKFTGEIQATSGKFTGEVNATSGKIKNVEAENITFKNRIDIDNLPLDPESDNFLGSLCIRTLKYVKSVSLVQGYLNVQYDERRIVVSK